MSMDKIIADLSNGSAGPECMLWTDPSLGSSVKASDMRRLCEALTAHGKIRTLSLSGNTIPDESAQVLAQWLSTCGSGVRVVDLSFCGLRSGAVAEVAVQISLNPRLSDVLLNVSFNEVDAPGCTALVDALARSACAGLKHLVLRYNPLVARGVAALVAGSGYLETLDCSYCNVVDVAPIEEALKATKLKTLRLCGLDCCIQKLDALHSTAARASCSLLLSEDIIGAESPAGPGAQSPTVMHSPEIEARYFKEELALLHDSVTTASHGPGAGSPVSGLRLPSPVNVRLFPTSPQGSAPQSPNSVLDYASGRVLRARGGEPVPPASEVSVDKDTATVTTMSTTSSPPPRFAVASEEPAPTTGSVATAASEPAADDAAPILTFTEKKKAAEKKKDTPHAPPEAKVHAHADPVPAAGKANSRRESTSSPTVKAKKKRGDTGGVSVSPMSSRTNLSPKRKVVRKKEKERAAPEAAVPVAPSPAKTVPATPVRETEPSAHGSVSKPHVRLGESIQFTPTGSSPPRAALSPVCAAPAPASTQSAPATDRPAGYAPTISGGARAEEARERDRKRGGAAKSEVAVPAVVAARDGTESLASSSGADDATLRSLSLALNVLSEKCNALTCERDTLSRELSAEANRRIAAEMEVKLLRKEVAQMKEQFASQVQRLASKRDHPRDTSPQPRSHRADPVSTPTHTRRSVSPKSLAAAPVVRTRRPLTDTSINAALERSPTNPRMATAAKSSGRTPCRSPTKQHPSRSPTRSHSLSKVVKRRVSSTSRV
eukprot:TRINITY_DN15701_c0_g1_i1.p1 TRINITY_DN15701_c0_g1~~TRINITY_DN15701_c0_g1_i1.p1  ORF type:complete len:775 (+),score=218.12 TRINITY_DN15701_c0_g1_i1:98-2422(+)